ncbi:MAG: phosphoribosyltransferase domain-containing protein [Sphingomonas sp.]
MAEIKFTAFTHDEMVAGIHAIAAQAAEWRPSLLVGVGRGGLAPSVFLSHRLGVAMVSIDHSTRIAQFGEELVAVLAQRTRAGDRLLFVEDINDSGRTIGEIRAALAAEQADPERVRFAVLIDNIRSRERVEYGFRTIDRSIDKDWFVFPWEAMASRAALAEEAVEVPERLG